MDFSKLFTQQLKSIVRFKQDAQEDVNPFQQLMKNIEPLHNLEQKPTIETKPQVKEDEKSGWDLDEDPDEPVADAEGGWDLDIEDEQSNVKLVNQQESLADLVPDLAQQPQSYDIKITPMKDNTRWKSSQDLPLKEDPVKSPVEMSKTRPDEQKNFLSIFGLNKKPDEKALSSKTIERVLAVNQQLFAMKELYEIERAEAMNSVDQYRQSALNEIQQQKEDLAEQLRHLKEQQSIAQEQILEARTMQKINALVYDSQEIQRSFEKTVQENLKLNDDIQDLNSLQLQTQQEYEDQLQEAQSDFQQYRAQAQKEISELKGQLEQANELLSEQQLEKTKTRLKLRDIQKQLYELRRQHLQTRDEVSEVLSSELIIKVASQQILTWAHNQEQEFETLQQQSMQRMAAKDEEIQDLYQELERAQSDLEKVQLENITIRSENDEMEQNYRLAREEAETLHQQLNKAQSSLQIAKEEKLELSKVIALNEEPHNQRYEKANKQLKEAERKEREHQLQLESNEKAHKRLSVDLQQSREQIVKLEQEVSELKKSKNKDLGQLFNFDEAPKDPWGLFSAPKPTQDDSQRQIAQLKEEQQRLLATIEKQKVEIEELKEGQQAKDQWGLDLDVEIEQPEESTQIELLNSVIEDLRSQLNRQHDELKRNTGYIESIRSEHSREIEDIIEYHKSQERRMADQLSEANQQKEYLQQCLEQMELQFKEERESVDKMGEDYHEVMKQLNMQRQLVKAKLAEIRSLKLIIEQIQGELDETYDKEQDQEQQMQKLQLCLVDAEYNSNLQKNKMQQRIQELEDALDSVNSDRQLTSSKRRSVDEEITDFKEVVAEEEEKAESEQGWAIEQGIEEEEDVSDKNNRSQGPQNGPINEPDVKEKLDQQYMEQVADRECWDDDDEDDCERLIDQDSNESVDDSSPRKPQEIFEQCVEDEQNTKSGDKASVLQQEEEALDKLSNQSIESSPRRPQEFGQQDEVVDRMQPFNGGNVQYDEDEQQIVPQAQADDWQSSTFSNQQEQNDEEQHFNCQRQHVPSQTQDKPEDEPQCQLVVVDNIYPSSDNDVPVDDQWPQEAEGWTEQLDEIDYTFKEGFQKMEQFEEDQQENNRLKDSDLDQGELVQGKSIHQLEEFQEEPAKELIEEAEIQNQGEPINDEKQIVEQHQDMNQAIGNPNMNEQATDQDVLDNNQVLAEKQTEDPLHKEDQACQQQPIEEEFHEISQAQKQFFVGEQKSPLKEEQPYEASPLKEQKADQEKPNEIADEQKSPLNEKEADQAKPIQKEILNQSLVDSQIISSERTENQFEAHQEEDNQIPSQREQAEIEEGWVQEEMVDYDDEEIPMQKSEKQFDEPSNNIEKEEQQVNGDSETGNNLTNAGQEPHTNAHESASKIVQDQGVEQPHLPDDDEPILDEGWGGIEEGNEENTQEEAPSQPANNLIFKAALLAQFSPQKRNINEDDLKDFADHVVEVLGKNDPLKQFKVQWDDEPNDEGWGDEGWDIEGETSIINLSKSDANLKAMVQRYLNQTLSEQEIIDQYHVV